MSVRKVDVGRVLPAEKNQAVIGWLFFDIDECQIELETVDEIQRDYAQMGSVKPESQIQKHPSCCNRG